MRISFLPREIIFEVIFNKQMMNYQFAVWFSFETLLERTMLENAWVGIMNLQLT